MRPGNTLGALGCAALALTLGAFSACTKAGLEDIPEPPRYRDDKLQVSGSLCTREPETLKFPVRVLFLVDSSESMAVTDPPDPVTGETRRERAVREAWMQLLEETTEGVRVGIVRFSAQAQSRTPVDLDDDGLADSYFTDSAIQLEVATAALGQTERTTNYVNALAEAFFELRAEMLQADLESLPLSKYIVILMSDGIPDVDASEKDQNSTDLILESVVALTDLAELFHVGEFSFNTIYLSSGQGPAVDQQGQQLLQAMAATGGGAYRSVPNGEEVNFLFVDFSNIRRVFTLRGLSVINMNTVIDTKQRQFLEGTPLEPDWLSDLDGDALVGCGEILTDTDGDGLADATEVGICTDPTIADTDEDGLGDRIEWELGQATDQEEASLDPNDGTDTSCFVASRCVDGDADGHCDCLLDVDIDGVCDCVVDPELECIDEAGHDCVDGDHDSWCDCPDRDGDGLCDREDTDGDGLGDCEELFLGTAGNGADTDADGIPDLMEHRFSTNAAEADDFGDLDWDLTNNGLEIALATDPLCEDTGLRSRTAYRYELHELGLSGSSTCYDFAVSNITLASTWEVAGRRWPGNGWNRILLFASEVAFDDPLTFARFRVACVEANYRLDGDFKNPPSGRMSLTDEDFVDSADFDPAVHCRRP